MIKPDIVVVGSCNIDFTFYTKNIPKRGQTIYGTKFMNSYGGKGGNQCIAATKLGASTAMIARLGDDYFGKEYYNLFKKLNVNTSHVTLTEGVSSGIAQITVSETEGDNYILIVEGANALLCPKDVQNAVDIIQHAKVGLFQFEISVKTTIEAMKLFKSNSKAKLILNPSPALQDVEPIIFKLLDILVLNETEAEGLSKQEVKTIKDGCNVTKHFLDLGCDTVIITLGRSGTVFATQKEPEPGHVAVEPIDNPVDPTGAGDLFTGSLAYAFVYKPDLKLSEKIRFASNIARECVKRPGAQESFPYKNDIPHLID